MGGEKEVVRSLMGGNFPPSPSWCGIWEDLGVEFVLANGGGFMAIGNLL